MGTMGIYKPLYVWCSPASIPQIVAHIQDYLVKNPIVSTETVAEIVVQSLQEHPELINGSVIPITEDSAQTIKEYIDALPLLDGYTKAETDALLLLKQNLLSWDQTPTAGSSNPVTSEGIKAAISATAAALADLISTKADIASVYTKSVMDTLLIQKADVATTYSKNAVDALLDTKVDINDTYTKADIDLMKQVDKANTAIVSSSDGTAPLNIAAGQYVYLNDILYMATQAISENDPLVPGTNIVLTPKGVANNIGDGLQNLARTVSTQSDQIEELETDLNNHGTVVRFPAFASPITVNDPDSYTTIGRLTNVYLKKGTYVLIYNISAKWTNDSYQFFSYISIDNTRVECGSYAISTDGFVPCIGIINVANDGNHEIVLSCRAGNKSKPVTVNKYQEIGLAMIKVR